LINRIGEIIAGHGRYEAAKLRGMKTVPVMCLDDLAPRQIRAYRIANRRLPECRQ
jgi:ParB-like chromosome segregation protein Spo0J